MDDFFLNHAHRACSVPTPRAPPRLPRSDRSASARPSGRWRTTSSTPSRASNWAVRRGYITYFIVHSSQVATHASYTKLAITMHMPTPMPLPATPNAELILGGEHTTPSLACVLSHVFMV